MRHVLLIVQLAAVNYLREVLFILANLQLIMYCMQQHIFQTAYQASLFHHARQITQHRLILLVINAVLFIQYINQMEEYPGK